LKHIHKKSNLKDPEETC